MNDLVFVGLILLKFVPIGVAIHFIFKTVAHPAFVTDKNLYGTTTIRKMTGFVYQLLAATGIGFTLTAALEPLLRLLPSDFQFVLPMVLVFPVGIFLTVGLQKLADRIAQGDYGKMFYEEATRALHVSYSPRWPAGTVRPFLTDADLPEVWAYEGWNAQDYLDDSRRTGSGLNDWDKDWIEQVWAEIAKVQKSRPKGD